MIYIVLSPKGKTIKHLDQPPTIYNDDENYFRLEGNNVFGYDKSTKHWIHLHTFKGIDLLNVVK